MVETGDIEVSFRNTPLEKYTGKCNVRCGDKEHRKNRSDRTWLNSAPDDTCGIARFF
jgi:hypothetical protein